METLNRFLFLKTFQGLRHAHGLIFKGQSLAPGVSCYALARCFTSHFSQDMKVVFHKAAKADLTRNYRFLCTVTANRVCWNCGSSTELFFCSSCKVIQPPRDDINYFQILNWWVNWLLIKLNLINIMYKCNVCFNAYHGSTWLRFSFCLFIIYSPFSFLNPYVSYL